MREKKIISVILLIGIVVTTVACSSNKETSIEETSSETDSEVIVTEDRTEIIEEEKNINTYSEENIINYDEVLYQFSIPDFTRDIKVGEYSTLFPTELQDVLVAANDDIFDGKEPWYKYIAKCDVIKSDEFDNYSFIYDVIDASAYGYVGNVGTISVVDIDDDEEDEYVMKYSVGTGKNSAMSVIKLIDSEWMDIGYAFTDSATAKYEILEWQGKYYLLAGDKLVYCKGGVEDINWSESVMPIKAKCWERITIDREVMNYTPIELYSQIEGDFYDCLQNINMIDIESNGYKLEGLYELWHTEYNYLTPYTEWTKEQDGKEYIYVTAGISGGTNYKNDLVLTIFEQAQDGQLEVIKLYYLVANLELGFE